MVGDPSSPAGDKMVIVSIWKEGKGSNQELLSFVEEVESDVLGYYREGCL
jgi:hypothetical protein